jgi:mannose-6-phosphate isomerase-like protein (cupin superfamily)
MPAPNARFILNVEQRVYVEKSWGHEDWIYNGRYCGKKLHVNKGKECSFHYHKVKDEVMYVESGKIQLTYGWDEDLSHAATITLTPDMAFHIPPGMWHKFAGIEQSVITEFSTHHNDKDVVRAGQQNGAENDDEEDGPTAASDSRKS